MHPFQVRSADTIADPARLAQITSLGASGVTRIETWELDSDWTAYRCIVIHLRGRAMVCAEPTRPSQNGKLGAANLRTWFDFDTSKHNPLAQDYVAEKMGFPREHYGHVDALNLTKLIAAALRRVALLYDPDVTGVVRWIPPTGVDE